MTRKKRRALLCMLAVPLLALAPRSEESLPASAAEPAAMPEKYVALTFDDGPWPETTEQLLDGLAERGAKATFFLIGEQIAGHEDTVRRMYQARINIPMQRKEVAKPQETNLEHKDTTILAEVMAAAKEIRRMGERANELQAQITELSEQGKDVDALLNEYGQVQDLSLIHI